MFRRKKKQPLPPLVVGAPMTKAASAKTKKALRFFNDEIPAVDLIEHDKTKKFVHSGYTKTIGDKFFELIEGKDLWQSLALIVTMVFVIVVVLWGIS